MTTTVSPPPARTTNHPATPENPADTGDSAEAASGGGKKKLVIIVLGVLVVLAAAYLMVLKPMLFPPHYKPGQKVPSGKIVSLPSNTINLADGHLLQLTVALQLTAPAQSTVVAADFPKFLNGELTIFGALTYPDLLNPLGRLAAQAALLRLFQHITGPSEGAQQISAVYFTSFVAQ